MRNKWVKLPAVVLAAGLSISAFAQDHASRNDFYISANVGYGGIVSPELPELVEFTRNTNNQGGLAWGAALGYLYAISQKYSLGGEVAYNNFNNNQILGDDIDTFDISNYNVTLSVVGVANLTEKFSLIAKVGGAIATQKMTVFPNEDFITDASKKTKHRYCLLLVLPWAINSKIILSSVLNFNMYWVNLITTRLQVC